MDTCIDTQATLGDICENTEVQSAAIDKQLQFDPSDAALNVDPVSVDASPPFDLHLVADNGGGGVHGGQHEIHLSELTITGIDDERDSVHSQNRDQGVVSPVSEEAPPSDDTIVPPDESSAINIDDSEIPTLSDCQGPPSLSIQTDLSATVLHDEIAVGVEEHANWTPHTEHIIPDATHPAYLMVEEETREGINYPCEEFPSSQPLSSSPPQIFSSSPCASSQSSDNDIEASKMVSAEETEACTNSHSRTHDDRVVLAAQDESRSEFNPLPSCDVTAIETLSNHCPDADSFLQIEGDIGRSRKRVAYRHDPNGVCGPQPSKRPKPDADPYLPPAPKRATVASHHCQFKKLATPFRPPTKLSVVRDGTVQTMLNKGTETGTSSGPAISEGDSEPRVPGKHHPHSRPKIPDTSRSVSQFKSPLINKVLTRDSRAVRLTPTVQTLERKLQLLKRAIKVKEDNEEEILIRLSGKWIEAGREVAYELWDATKDTVDLEGKATLRKSYGWNDTNEGNVPWGWDAKLEDTGEGSCNPDPSMASRAAQWVTPEEDDDDVWNYTLGTMLRQLGIDPQTFGWDDDKETFSD